jgi:carboxypeptidase Q
MSKRTNRASGGLLVLLAAAPVALAAGAPPSGPAPGVRADAYVETAGRIRSAALDHGQAYDILAYLTDRIGPRLSGTPAAEQAVRWATDRLKAYGLETWTEPVMVPRWVRGEESAFVVAPVEQKLVLTALGGSDPTPPAGITAPVVEVADFDDLHALGAERVRGHIVLYNKAIGRGVRYADVVPLRIRGAIEAARLGAVASLVRSLGILSARLPHTGLVDYDANVPRIPAAALTAEDADLLHRLLAKGDSVQVRLRLGCRTLEDVPSANVIADLKGRATPEEIVLIGAHIDSWDVGPGAVDDGSGVAMVIEALRILKSLGLQPRRTIRGVLYINEENGVRGGLAYADGHRDELARHVAAIEADEGVGRPLTIGGSVGAGGIEMLKDVARVLSVLGPMQATESGGGVDISPLEKASVPTLAIDVADEDYLAWHHSAADTLDKVDPRELAEDAAALAIAAYVLADLPAALPRPPAPAAPSH